jgi:hypothetical protein
VACGEQFDVGEISNDEGRMLRKKDNEASKKSNDGDGDRTGDEGTIDQNTKNYVAHDSQTLKFAPLRIAALGACWLAIMYVSNPLCRDGKMENFTC